MADIYFSIITNKSLFTNEVYLYAVYVKSEYPNFDNLNADVYSIVSPQPGMFFRLANHQKQIGSSGE